MDLYRLSPDRPDDFAPLDLDRVFRNCVSLVEWPSRLAGSGYFDDEDDVLRSPDGATERLDIEITIMEDDRDADVGQAEDRPRRMLLTPHGSFWKGRLQQLKDQGYLDDLLLEDY